jgi:hypothetical protein
MTRGRQKDRTNAVVSGLTEAHSYARELANVISEVHGLSIANGDTLTFSEDLISPVVGSLNHARALARSRHRARIDLALGFAGPLQLLLDGSYSRETWGADADRCFTLVRDLERACDTALTRALGLDRVSSPNADPREDAAAKVAPAAGRVLAVAVRMLPAADRVRYASEYHSEQYELAVAGARRLAQLAYAGRQLRSAWSLRAELRVPTRRAAP